MRAIVRFHDEAARTRGARTIAQRGGSVRRSLNDIGALNTVVDAATAQALANEAGVATISVDAEVRSSAPASRAATPIRTPPTASAVSSSSGRPAAASRWRSSTPVCARMPTCRRPRIRKFVDFVNGRTQPYDDFGHGTHVAGILAGSGAASARLEDPYLGMAPEVDLVVLKVLDGSGAGTHERRHRRARMGRRQPRRLQHPRRQHVARPSGVRAGVDRSAGAGG